MPKRCFCESSAYRQNSCLRYVETICRFFPCVSERLAVAYALRFHKSAKAQKFHLASPNLQNWAGWLSCRISGKSQNTEDSFNLAVSTVRYKTEQYCLIALYIPLVLYFPSVNPACNRMLNIQILGEFCPFYNEFESLLRIFSHQPLNLPPRFKRFVACFLGIGSRNNDPQQNAVILIHCRFF